MDVDRAACGRANKDRRATWREDGARFGSLGGGIAAILGGRVGAGRADVAGCGLARRRRRGGAGMVRAAFGRDLALVVRREDGRQPAGAEIREEIDQGVEDAEQHQADTRPEHAHDHALVTPRRDRLAQVVQDDRQIGIGVKRGGVGHDRS
jgi:hypothetical protein